MKVGAGQSGFSLIELMIAVAIMGIIIAVALPSYQDYVVRSNRGVGVSKLMEMASRQEQYFLNNQLYADTLTKLGYPDPYYVDSDGDMGTVGSAIYQLSIKLPITASTNTFDIEAAPLNFQTRDDDATDPKDCRTLSLDEQGVKGQSGLGTRCWN